MIESNIKTASQILNDAADFLEQSDRWHKGAFFKANESNPVRGCSMCAHGAIMYCSSDLVKEKADMNNSTVAIPAAAATAVDVRDAGALARVAAASAATTATTAAAGANYYKNLASLEGLSIPEYLRKRYGESAVAHYKANLIGLKYEYNDAPGTTKQDVINKLREAAQVS